MSSTDLGSPGSAAPRLRFAPAPSGSLHVGNARAALYNWLWARRTGGTFVLRVEDTDADRVSEESYAGVLEALRFLGLDWDEGPGVEGPHGPYRQSERRELHAAVAAALLESGACYDAYETPEELAAEREAAQRAGRPPGYGGGHRDLTDAQRGAFLAEGRRAVVRLRTPDAGSVAFDDHVRGRVEVAWKDVPDPVLQRADGSPTYYLANTVDDVAMGITLIARGEDLLSATPRQLLLWDALTRDGLIDAVLAEQSFPARPAREVDPARPDPERNDPPAYAHLPLLVGEDRKPLSKRHGSVAVEEFRRQGVLPEALVNVLALCGWSPEDGKDRLDADELVERFSFERVGRTPALFDQAKLRALNGERIKSMADDELGERLQPYLVEAGAVSNPMTADDQRLLLSFVPLLRERVQLLTEAVPLVAPFFADVLDYDEADVAKHLRGVARDVLDQAEAALGAADWDATSIQAALDAVAEGLGLGRGKAYQPVRVAVSGRAISPPLPETLALLDRDAVLARLRAAKALVTN